MNLSFTARGLLLPTLTNLVHILARPEVCGYRFVRTPANELAMTDHTGVWWYVTRDAIDDILCTLPSRTSMREPTRRRLKDAIGVVAQHIPAPRSRESREFFRIRNVGTA